MYNSTPINIYARPHKKAELLKNNFVKLEYEKNYIPNYPNVVFIC